MSGSTKRAKAAKRGGFTLTYVWRPSSQAPDDWLIKVNRDADGAELRFIYAWRWLARLMLPTWRLRLSFWDLDRFHAKARRWADDTSEFLDRADG